MASGRLGAISPVANTLTELYQNVSGTIAGCTLTVCNTNPTTVTFRLAISTATVAGSVVTADYIVYDHVLGGNSEYQVTGNLLSNNEVIWVEANNSGVAFQARGPEGTL